jgi:imidazolonepropionase-like amidohydrolase
MWRMLRLFVCAVATLWLAAAAFADTTVYRHATLVDATAPAPRPNMTLVVRDGVIAQILTDAEAAAAKFDGAKSVDLRGMFVAPGLVDTHVHVATEAKPAVAKAMLELYLMGGVTTVRDMAGDTRLLGPLRDELKAGTIVGPDLHYSALMAGPSFFDDPRTQSSAKGAVAGEVAWMRAIKTDTDVAKAVADAKATGASGIKLYANLDGATAARIVDEAKRQGLMSWAHAALLPARPSEVIATGMTSVSHVYMFGYETAAGMETATYAKRPPVDFTKLDANDPAFVALYDAMIAKGVVLDATVFVTKAIAANPKLPPEKRAERLAQYAFSLKLARAAQSKGVVVTAGSDASVGTAFGTPGLWDEMLALQNDAGFTPAEVLAAATINGAKLLGLSEKQGTLEAGKRADFIVLKEDPLKDIAAVKSIVMTMKNGRVFERARYRVTKAVWTSMEE